MNRKRTSTLIGLLAITSATFAIAQTTPPDNTSPSSASTPSQRDATKSQSAEAPTTDGSNPASAASPHQQQAVSGNSSGASSQKQSMKDCMSKEKAKNSGSTKDQMKKTCTDQMKASPN
jgi:hypothetical protein